MQQDQDISVSLGDIFRFLRRGLLPALLLALVGAGVAYFLSRSQDPVYRTEATLLVTSATIDLGGLDVPIVAAPSINPSFTEPPLRAGRSSRAALAHSAPRSRRRAWRALPSASTASTEVNPAFRESGQISPAARGSDPEEITTTVNALALALVDWDQQRAETYITDIINQLDRTIAATENRARGS
jgi:hypothetical protein